MDQTHVAGQPPTIENVYGFMDAFATALYEATVAKYTEREDEPFRTKVRQVAQFLSHDVDVMLARPRSPDDRWFSVGKEMVQGKTIVPMRVLQIKEYRHPSLGTLFRVYTSSTLNPTHKPLDYATNFYVSVIDGSLKIISRYDVDILPQEGARLVDGGLSWMHYGGVVLDMPGSLIRTRKYQPPHSKAQLEEYESA